MKGLLSIVVLFIAIIDGEAQSNRIIEVNGQEEISIDPFVDFYIDESGELSREEIIGKKFLPAPNGGVRTEATNSAVWFKLKINNEASRHQNYFLQFIDPSIYHIVIHDKDSVYETGTKIQPAIRPIKGNKPTYFLTLRRGEEREILIRASSTNKMTLHATLVRHDIYLDKNNDERFYLGLFYGALILLFVYSILLLVTTRQRMFAYYGGYIFFVALLTGAGDGITAEYAHGWIRWKDGFQDAAAALCSNVLGLMFMILFLEVKNWSNKLYKLNVWFMLSQGALALIFLQMRDFAVFDILALFGLAQIFLTIFTSVMAVRQRIPQAEYYLTAYAIFGVFVVWFILSLFRVVPYGFVAQYSIHLGYGFSVLILSYGVGVRIYSVYIELLKKEQEKQEIIKQKNEELEEQVTLRTNFLAEKEGNLRAIIDNHTNAIWLINDRYELIDCNTVFRDDWKTTFDKELELGISIVDQIPIENLKARWKVRFDVTLDGKAGIYNDKYKIGEELVHLEIKTFPIYQDGVVRGASIFSSDVTERINAQNRLENQNDMLKKVNQELDSFVYSASHDLKAPLASVLGLINISRIEKDEQEKQNYYNMMETSVKRLDQFIMDIIDYSRNARTNPEATKVDLKSILDNVFEDLRYIYEKDRVKVNINIDQINDLYTDPTRLRVIIRNILSNALKYGCPDPENNVIDIDASIGEKSLLLTIADHGPGINEEYQPHLFDMFYRASETTSGTGLGLYIVKETVAKLNGQITLKSKIKEGTSFTIEIPNEAKS